LAPSFPDVVAVEVELLPGAEKGKGWREKKKNER